MTTRVWEVWIIKDSREITDMSERSWTPASTKEKVQDATSQWRIFVHADTWLSAGNRALTMINDHTNPDDTLSD